MFKTSDEVKLLNSDTITVVSMLLYEYENWNLIKQ